MGRIFEKNGLFVIEVMGGNIWTIFDPKGLRGQDLFHAINNGEIEIEITSWSIEDVIYDMIKGGFFYREESRAAFTKLARSNTKLWYRHNESGLIREFDSSVIKTTESDDRWGPKFTSNKLVALELSLEELQKDYEQNPHEWGKFEEVAIRRGFEYISTYKRIY